MSVHAGPPTMEIRQQLQDLIDTVPHNDSVIRDGEYCRSPGFLAQFGDEEVQRLLQIYFENEHTVIPMLLAQESEAHLMSYFKTKAASDLKTGIAIGSLVAYHTLLDPENSVRGALLSVFGRSLLVQSQANEADDRVLDESIEYCRKAVTLGDPQGWNRPLHLNDLGQQLTTRYARQHLDTDYTEAEESFQQASELKPAGKPVFLFRWAKLIRERDEFEGCEKEEMLRKYITKLGDAVRSESKAFNNFEYRVSISCIWWNLGTAMWERYQLTNSPEDLEKASKIYGFARGAPQHDSNDRFRSCRDLGRVNALQFKESGDLEKGEAAVTMLKEALQVEPDSMMVIESLADHLRIFADYADSDEMLTESANILEKAYNQSKNPSDSLSDAQALTFMQQFKRTGKPEDIEVAIQRFRTLVDRSHGRAEDQAQYFLKLSQCLLSRFEAFEKQDDLDEAQAEATKAFSLETTRQSIKGDCIRVQGLISNARYKWSNKPEHLDQAIAQYRLSLEKVSDKDKHLVRNDLANAYYFKFKRTLLLEDLSESIRGYDTALHELQQSGRKDSKKDNLMISHGLAISLTAQFEVTQQQQDIDGAITCYEKCFQGAAKKTIHGLIRANNLALAYQERYKLTGQIEDVKKSQTVLLEVLAWGLDVHPNNRCNMHNNLGRAFLLSYIELKEPSYLNYAAEHFRKADATGCTLPDFQVAASVNLSRVLLLKARETKQRQDQFAVLLQLTKSLSYLGNMQNITDHSHTDGIIYNMLEFILDSWMDSGYSAESTSGQLYLTASKTLIPHLKTLQSSAIARFYIFAAIAQHIVAKQPGIARDVIRTTAEILPKSMLLSFDRRDILNNLANFTGLPSFAIACSLAAGDSPYMALELFDKVRSVMWDSVLSNKMTLREKEIENFPELRDRLAQVIKPLAGTKGSQKTPSVSEIGGMLVQQHEIYRQGVEYQQLWDQLESHPELERFTCLPADMSAIAKYAEEGPVIIVNYGIFRSDALILTKEGVESISLPLLTGQALEENDNLYLEALSIMGIDLSVATQKMNQLLEWIWDAVAEPILDRLGFGGDLIEGSNLPRSWWITTGRIGTFPLHAAGNPHKGASCNVLDRTVPSYINGLRALDYTRSQRSTRPDDPAKPEKRALLISMESTPEMGEEGNLPGASREVTKIEEIVNRSGGKSKLLHSPSRAEVLRHLNRADFAHFACHGVCDGDDPARSALRLTDWQTKPLDVECLLQQNKSDMRLQLVYLSACESASNKSKFRDEGLHLAGGFQMAGVPYVIASLWRADDTFSFDMAARFYQSLGALGSNCDPTQSAKVLRQVVVEMRDSV
ncbi:unnamed protein product [Penicillium manginii]